MNDNMKIAFCWYHAEEWQKLKERAADVDILDDTYDEWKSNATRAVKDLRAEGQLIQKVKINIDDLEAWCAQHNKENNSAARSEFAVEILKRRQSTLKA